MIKITRFHAFLPVALTMLGCATKPSGMTFDSPLGEWSETYETYSGSTRTSRFIIVDETLGTYPGGQVQFFATEDPYHWKGYWINEEGKQACEQKKDDSPYWGVMTYNFNETYNRYNGTWDQCGEGRNWPISGLR